LRELNLSGFYLDSIRISYLVKAIESVGLRVFQLTRVSLDDDGTALIAAALRNNSMEELDLSSNDIHTAVASLLLLLLL
jgi:hypothetical protein